MKRNDAIKIVVTAILLIIAYIPAFSWMYARWSATDTYYSHGFLVPFISVFLVWQKRKVLAKIPLKPDALGWIFFGVGLTIHGVSVLWNIGFTSGFSLILVIIGMVLLFFGREYLRQLMFPILFLAFMVPLPEVAIANLSFRLKIFAAQIATFIARWLGVPAIREGSMIHTRHANLMVEDPCSGIRSLIALIALGALMAYYSNLSKIKRGVVFVSSIPIAVGTNVIRIISLLFISEIYGQQYATGVVHDTLGILVFVIAFVALATVGKLLE